MTKTAIRLAALATALLFGTTTVLPMTATAANMPTKTTAVHSTAKHKKKTARRGSAAVKSLQEALNKNGANVSVDGKMGPKTRAALKSFQQGHGLKATGKLDKATKAALSRG